MAPEIPQTAVPVAVIGAGPAGLMAAQVLAAAGVAVALFDAMPAAGRKFLLAGRGGLNLTNAEEPAAFARRYGTQAPFFTKILASFSPADLRNWAAALGIATYVGSSGRVFPHQAGASDLLQAWLRHLEQLGVRFHFQHRWQGFTPDNRLLFQRRNSGPVVVTAAATLLALGGASWPQTGSDGAWPQLLAARDVLCNPFKPANCGIHVAWSPYFRQRFAGCPLKNLLLRCGPCQAGGDVVITEYGLEGGGIYPLIPALRAELEQLGAATLYLDLKRDLSQAQIQEKLSKKRGPESLTSFLRKTLRLTGPTFSLLREFCSPREMAAIAGLADRIKNLPLPITGFRPLAEAISVAGGISFAEVNDDLMLTRLPGVFAAGEMLDWEAPTGGFLLQGAFATGHWAAGAIQRWLDRS